MENHTFTNTTVTLKKQAKENEEDKTGFVKRFLPQLEQILCLTNYVSVELNSKSKKGEKNNCGRFTVGQLRNISVLDA